MTYRCYRCSEEVSEEANDRVRAAFDAIEEEDPDEVLERLIEALGLIHCDPGPGQEDVFGAIVVCESCFERALAQIGLDRGSDYSPREEYGGASVSLILARGVLTWTRAERISDRYGAVFLMAEGNSEAPEAPVIFETESLKGKRGRLGVRIIEPRRSSHIGDLFRGFFQERLPDKGAKFVLGEGEFFSETFDRWLTVGVRPDDGRESDWLDPETLYAVHESVVDLLFEEVEA